MFLSSWSERFARALSILANPRLIFISLFSYNLVALASNRCSFFVQPPSLRNHHWNILLRRRLQCTRPRPLTSRAVETGVRSPNTARVSLFLLVKFDPPALPTSSTSPGATKPKEGANWCVGAATRIGTAGFVVAPCRGPAERRRGRHARARAQRRHTRRFARQPQPRTMHVLSSARGRPFRGGSGGTFGDEGTEKAVC
jgi:hypothetical protein